MRNVPCRVCGRPVRGQSICGDCKQAASYANPEFRVNARAMCEYASFVIAQGNSVPCIICSRAIHDMSELSIEHVKPLRDGGTHARDNLSYAHRACNSLMKPAEPKKRYQRP